MFFIKEVLSLFVTKMNGNGNDFILLNNISLKYSDEEMITFSTNLCRRGLSVGADGVLVAEPSAICDFKMRLFNADGSEGEMCGNGARCIARYAYEYNIVQSLNMTFETLGGNIHATVDGRQVSIQLASVNINDVILNGRCIVEGESFTYNYLTVGVPHVVIFENKKRSDNDYRHIGRLLRNRTDLFTDGANVNFVTINDEPNSICVTTYERGVEDLTLSCGTGSTASALCSFLLNKSCNDVDVHTPGGINRIKINLSSDNIASLELEGMTSIVAELKVMPEALV